MKTPFRISCDDGCASDMRLAELCMKYMFDDVAKAMVPFFEPHADLLDQFYQEHRHDEQETQYEFASRQHDLRSKRIYPAVVPPVGVLVEQSEEPKETPVDSQEVAE